MSTYTRRQRVAAKIQLETGVRVEAMHPAGTIGIAYIVDTRGASNAYEARREARRIREQMALDESIR